MARVETDGSNPGVPFWRLLAVCAVALTTANCANPQKFATGAGSGSDIDPKYGVKASKRLYNEGDVIPKGGGRRFSGKPYVVAGRTYVPREDARGYVREGLASWYGAAFHGRMTANGEVFDRMSIAAAHPTLPLPSYARVTNLQNGHSMVVRVNDRGPYHADRVMDVSEEVARALEFHNKGTARVRVEYVGKASTAGSDDRKLLATLRTDGVPAGLRSPVMVADLGPDAAPSAERFAGPARPALAFRPAPESEDETGDAPETAPIRRPARPAPVLVAGAASVPVPVALQPTASRAAAFRPTAVASMGAASSRTATVLPSRTAPLSLAPPPIRLASAASERGPVTAPRGNAVRLDHVAVATTTPTSRMAPPRAGSAPAVAALPSASKLAMARLAAASGSLASAGAKPAGAHSTGKVAASRRPQLASVD